MVSIEDNLHILQTSLINLSGLDNLSQVAAGIDIINNDLLISVQELESISGNVGRIYVLGNSQLESLNGLNNVNQLSSLYIYDNNLLENLEGLSNLNHIEWDLTIQNNQNLVRLDGLENVTNICGDDVYYSSCTLDISGNSLLIDVDALYGVTSFGLNFEAASNSASNSDIIFKISNNNTNLCFSDVLALAEHIILPQFPNWTYFLGMSVGGPVVIFDGLDDC